MDTKPCHLIFQTHQYLTKSTPVVPTHGVGMEPCGMLFHLHQLVPLMFKTSVATGDQALQYFSAIVMQPEGVDIIHEAYMYVKGHQQEFYDAENV